MDDFYKNGDDPSLPRLDGRVNWESPQAWDAEAAVQTIARLVREGKAEVPVYAIGADRRVDTRLLDLTGSPIFVAEGIFAAEIAPACRSLGLLAEAYALRRSRWLTFVRRLLRDLTERRKAPGLLVRRGVALLRAEPTVLARQAGLGCRPASGRSVLRRVAQFQDRPTPGQRRQRPVPAEPASDVTPSPGTTQVNPAASRTPV
ncbi:ATP-binding protein [Plantactinospora sp. GCM10030261]|uniref:ATP-binding protein n=1 Tax=Plantactinospora sp. GCM10030261 TaxID=3273420 RepID=UPI0036197992